MGRHNDIVLSAFGHRSFDLADIGIVFKPQTDLYILNANHIVRTGRVKTDFVDSWRCTNGSDACKTSQASITIAPPEDIRRRRHAD